MVHINDRSVRKKQRKRENNSVKHGYSTKRYNKKRYFLRYNTNTYGSNSTNISKKQRSYLSQQQSIYRFSSLKDRDRREEGPERKIV